MDRGGRTNDLRSGGGIDVLNILGNEIKHVVTEKIMRQILNEAMFVTHNHQWELVSELDLFQKFADSDRVVLKRAASGFNLQISERGKDKGKGNEWKEGRGMKYISSSTHFSGSLDVLENDIRVVLVKGDDLFEIEIGALIAAMLFEKVNHVFRPQTVRIRFIGRCRSVADTHSNDSL